MAGSIRVGRDAQVFRGASGLDGIDLEVRRGEMLTILGQRTGKSVLLS